jgi:UV DNA damage endonuclease
MCQNCNDDVGVTFPTFPPTTNDEQEQGVREESELCTKQCEQEIYIPENFNFGYACLNTVLRSQKPSVFSSRTVRLATYQQKGLDYIKELSIQNLKDLLTILKWNKENGVYFMRMSSEMFPFASHPEHGYDIVYAKEYLQAVGDYAKQNGMRLTMHPGQYDVLSSNKDDVIKHTILDLEHHAQIMDLMGLNQNGVMIIHGGGVYGNKKKALERLEDNIKALSENVRNRLVLENCEMAYTVEDLLDISERLQVPIVMDTHHDAINPSSKPLEFYFDRVFEVWNNRGIKPKMHLSNSVPGILDTDTKTARRKHSDYIAYFHECLYKITFPIDIMLECKMKEQALLKLKQIKQ